MAAESTTGTTRRTVKRLSADEKRAKVESGVTANIAKAGTALISVAEGFMARGDRTNARAALDLWSAVVDLGTAKPAENGEAPADS